MFDKLLPEPKSLTIVQFDLFFEQAVGSFHLGIDKPIGPSPDLIVLAEMEILLPLAKKQIYDPLSDSLRNDDGLAASVFTPNENPGELPQFN